MRRIGSASAAEVEFIDGAAARVVRAAAAALVIGVAATADNAEDFVFPLPLLAPQGKTMVMKSMVEVNGK